MHRFQKGDSEAFDVVFGRYASHIVNFAWRFLQSQQDAEDLAQEVLLRVYHGKDRYQSGRPFKPWIFAIASRLISNQRRNKARHKESSLDVTSDETDTGSLVSRMAAPSADEPDAIPLQNERIHAVQEALRSLPENQRTAVVLARYHEMSNEQIAQTMGVSLSATKSLLFRARWALRDALASFAKAQTGSRLR